MSKRENKYYGRKQYLVEDRCKTLSDDKLIAVRKRFRKDIYNGKKTIRFSGDSDETMTLYKVVRIIYDELMSRGYSRKELAIPRGAYDTFEDDENLF